WIGFRALALATSVAALGNGGVLAVLLRRRLNGIEGERLTRVFLKLVVASAAMAGAVWGVEAVMSGLLPTEQLLARGVRLLTAIGGGLLVLGGVAKALRIDEFEDVVQVRK